MKPGMPDLDRLLNDLGLTEAEVAERKAFLELGAEDVRLLTELHALLDQTGTRDFFVNAFYDHLQAFAGLRALLRDPATLGRLKHSQAGYFDGLTAGDYGPEYVRHRVRVGLAHERVGLAPKWYLGAYSKYLNLLVAQIGMLLPQDPDRVQRMAQALLKIVMFDMGLAIDTYIHASESALQRTNERLEALNRLALTLTSAQELAVILDQVMIHGAELIGAKAACIAFYDPDSRRFKDWVATGLSPSFVRNMDFRPGGLADEAFTTGTHVLSNDRPETRHRLSRLMREEGIRGIVCLPLTSRAQRLGVIYFYRSDRDSFEAAEIELLTTFARLAASAIENAQLYARLENEARIDVLTGLYNRRVFDQRLEEEHRRATRYGKPYALMLLDIDHFKRVNDQYGHPAGDAVLTALGRLLAVQVRDVDTAARYGGEEFAVIFPEISGSAAREIAERIRNVIAAMSFALPDGGQISITVSAGISCFPHCAPDARAVVSAADQALYAAKQAGRNCVLMYRDTLKARLEQDPEQVVALLAESPDHAQPIATAVAAIAPFLRQHAQHVGRIAELLATALGLSPEDRETLRLAALLHDIGMLTVPEVVLNKRTPLEADEQELIRRHPVIAAAWLARVPALSRLAPLVRHHHERFDGQGYPDGLRGEEIPLLARALALADAYAAMVSDWPGRPALSAPAARAELRAGAGGQFDPRLVERLLQALGEQPS
jgi:diguanylate cyclase (GGDEF)-like protein/putative nucleotidyltransferase with HDIG domain